VQNDALLMILLEGHVVQGLGHFRQRMTKYPEVFRRAAGVSLFPGTLNVKVDREIPVKEQFRILGVDIGEPEQDLLFEECRINGIKAYRVRPYHLQTGSGGYGDDILEITCSQEIPNVPTGSAVEVELFRDDIKS
jgi:CTP-dependent riboflavin kinase